MKVKGEQIKQEKTKKLSKVKTRNQEAKIKILSNL